MKVLLPITDPQNIVFVPRQVILENLSMVITKDGEGTQETFGGLSAIIFPSNTNFVQLFFTSTFLEEGHSYFVEISAVGGTRVIYRDKFYVTSQTDFTIKHKQSQNNYTQYNTVDDNTYIV